MDKTTKRPNHLTTILLCALALTLYPSLTFAQVGQYRTDLAVGVNGGYMMSSVSFVPKVPQDQLGGTTIGFTARYTCEKYFNSICAIVGEVNYVHTGWKERILDINDQPVLLHSDTTQALRFSRKLTYLQVPVFARMGWGRERSGLQAFFQAGPQLAVYISDQNDANFDVRQTPFNPGPTGNRNPDYQYYERTSHVVAQDTMAVENKFDYGITVGAGIEFSHRRLGHFILEGRYYYGLGNIYGNTKRDYFARSNYNTINIKLTYLFDIIRTRNPKIK